MFETVIKNVQKLENKTHWESNFSVIIESEIATKKSQTVLKVPLLVLNSLTETFESLLSKCTRNSMLDILSLVENSGPYAVLMVDRSICTV